MRFRKTEVKYLSRQDWTGDSRLNPLVNFDFSRTRFGGQNSGARANNAANGCPTGKSVE